MPLLQQAITTFLQIERRPATTLQYRFVLEQMSLTIGPGNQVDRVTYEILLDYQAHLRTLVSASTVANYSSIIKAFFNWCARRGYAPASPAADLLRKKPPRDPHSNRAIPADELRRIVEYARVTSSRNFAILMFLADTGCRVNAAANLRVSGLHLENGYADVVEKGGIYKRVLFGEETAAALAVWAAERPDLATEAFFGIKRGAIEAMLKTISRKVGASREWYPHSLRHAVGHAFAAAGVPPTITARKLNHGDVATTLYFYYPNHDPYLEMTSKRLSLASMKSSEELRPKTATVIPLHKKTGT